jgi:phosphoacetylglucosamine mutase
VSQNSLQLPVVITKTGVKHLHHAALEFDIGIYFVANGHGTVLFSERYHQVVAAASNKNPILSALPKLIHPAVGDALSDMLLIDVMLQSLHCWTLQDWNGKLYTDLPSRQLKVKVEDRLLVQCNENETKCLHPATLQPALDQAMASVPNG